MKSRQLFFGSAFISLGAFWLLSNSGIINTLPEIWTDLWPLLLVFWGLSIILKQSKAGFILNILFGMFSGLLLFDVVVSPHFQWKEGYHLGSIGNYSARTYREPYNNKIQEASLNLECGAAMAKIQSGGGDLVNIYTKAPSGEYSYSVRTENSKALIDFGGNQNFNISDRNKARFLNICLSPVPIWDLHIEAGAAKADYDLSGLRLRNASIEAGASSLSLKLGNKYPAANLSVEIGAAKLVLSVPKSSGLKLTGETTLMSKDLGGLKKLSDGTYVSDNYGSSKEKIDLKIDGALSSIKVLYY